MARAASDRETTVVDLDLGLHLPITVSCLWALSETTVPRFSVLTSARQSAPLTLTRSGGTNGR